MTQLRFSVSWHPRRCTPQPVPRNQSVPHEEIESPHQDLRCLLPPLRLAQEMGTGLGSGPVLFRRLPTRRPPARQTIQRRVTAPLTPPEVTDQNAPVHCAIDSPMKHLLLLLVRLTGPMALLLGAESKSQPKPNPTRSRRTSPSISEQLPPPIRTASRNRRARSSRSRQPQRTCEARFSKGRMFQTTPFRSARFWTNSTASTSARTRSSSYGVTTVGNSASTTRGVNIPTPRTTSTPRSCSRCQA